MTSKLKCPFCSADLESTTGGWEHGCTNDECQSAGTLCGTKELWQALIQSQQQLKILEPIVASLQGRADINAEEARDSNELVHQWYEKYEQSRKDLEIARKALEEIKENYEERFKAERDGFTVNWDIVAAFYARNIVANSLKKIEHKEM